MHPAIESVWCTLARTVADEPQGVPLLYVGADEVPITLANQFGITFDSTGGEFLFTVGQLQLPLLIGSDEDKEKQLRQLSFVAIKVLGRYSLTRPQIVEWSK